MTEAQLLRLWGKTFREEPKPGAPPTPPNPADTRRYHPVLFHLLDVGHVTLLLWRGCLDENGEWHGCLSERQRRRIAVALGLSVAEAGVVVVLLAALHDLGKAGPAFQAKSEAHREGVEDAGFAFPSTRPCREVHSYTTAADLPRLVAAGGAGWTCDEATARVLAAITGAHHGSFPKSTEMDQIHSDTLGDARWQAARDALAEHTVRLLFPDRPADAPLPNCPQLTDPAVVPLLAGLISVADWVGSNQELFPPAASLDEPPPCSSDYAALSRDKAREALGRFGWWPRVTFAERAAFADTFPGLRDELAKRGIALAPNALQRTVAEQAEMAAGAEGGAPFLMIVEAAMGGGKTEAAEFVADRALADGRADGLFIGLPTQATGNGLFRRLRRDYFGLSSEKGDFTSRRGHRGALNLQLLHGNALLDEAFRGSVRWPVQKNGPRDAEDSRLTAEGWFTSRKRPLLAPFGVGTIDQSLLGVLQTRHWFVRLFGLSGKVVVFDEVHAYDTYMSELLRRLIEWLARLDCTVILLSATLPAAKRRGLMDAYRAGSSSAAGDAAYPRVSWVRAGDGEPRPGEDAAAVTVPPDDPDAKPRHVALRWAGTAPEEVARLVARELPDGGCGAVLCNTVGRAQQVYAALREAAGRGELPGWAPDDIRLFHARTPFGWRRATEEWCVTEFGKDARRGGNPARPERAILVATQVIEQSLDLDFDWMASDLAPVDLVLQRIGRLHRHRREESARPASVRAPRLVLLCDVPGGAEGEGEDDAPPGFAPGSERVYEPYLLLRSYLALRGREHIALPDDIEPLVAAVYDADAPADGLSPAWTAALKKAEERMNRGEEDDTQAATLRLVPEPQEPRYLFRGLEVNLIDDEDPTTHRSIAAVTRLGPPSVTVVCLGTGEDGEPLGVSPDAVPNLEQVRVLLEWSCSVSDRGLYGALVGERVPDTWRESAHLRHCRPVTFHDGEATVGGKRLRLNEREGLVYMRGSVETSADAEAEETEEDKRL